MIFLVQDMIKTAYSVDLVCGSNPIKSFSSDSEQIVSRDINLKLSIATLFIRSLLWKSISKPWISFSKETAH